MATSDPNVPDAPDQQQPASRTIRETEATPLLAAAEAPEDALPPEVPKIGLSRLRGLCVGLSLWAMILLLSINLSGMAMVQGAIAEDLGVSENPIWLSTAFFVPVSALAPLFGRLATVIPSRALLLPIAGLMASGSLLSAFARTPAVFIVGRVATGAGGAGIMSLMVVFVLEMATGKSRGIMVGFLNAGMTVGVSVGAILFGGLLPVVGWRPLFWAQAPVSLVAGFGAFFSIPSGPAKSDKPDSESLVERLRRIDYLGACFLTLTIVLFLFGLADDIEPLFLCLSLASLILFIIIEMFYATDCIIPLNVLFSRGALLSCLSQLGLMSARWTVLFYSPIFMLAVRGVAPAAAGSILVPTNIGFGLGSIVVGWAHVRRSGAFWLPSIVSMAFFAVLAFVLALVSTSHGSTVAFIIVVFANGFATGAALNYTLAHLLHLTPGRDSQYVATSLMATFRSFGGSFGTAIGGGVFYRLLKDNLSSGFLELDGGVELSPSRRRLVSRLLASPGLVFHGQLSAEAHGVAVEGYAGALRGLWQAATALALIMVVIQALTGWNAAQHETVSDENRHDDEE